MLCSFDAPNARTMSSSKRYSCDLRATGEILQDEIQLHSIHFNTFQDISRHFKIANCHQQHPPTQNSDSRFKASATSGPSLQVPHSATVYSFMAASSRGTSLSVSQCDVAAGLPGLGSIRSIRSIRSLTPVPRGGCGDPRGLDCTSSINFHQFPSISIMSLYNIYI